MNSVVFLITVSLLFMLFLAANTSEEEKQRNTTSVDQVGWSDLIDALRLRYSSNNEKSRMVSIMGSLLISAFPALAASISSSILLSVASTAPSSLSYCTASGRNKRCSFIEASSNELDRYTIESLETSEAPKPVGYFAQVAMNFEGNVINCSEIASSKQESRQVMTLKGLSMTVFGLIPPINQRAFIKRIKSSIVLNSTHVKLN